jgi:methionine-rich copper-binding protein CopC
VMKKRFATGWLAMLLLLLGWPMVSMAHTHMEKSKPADGAQLVTAPSEVDLWFTSKVAAEWSTIKVKDAAGKRVDDGEVSDGGDPKHLVIKLQPLSSGKYDVHFNVISGDGHRVKGSLSFSVQ